MAVNSQHKQYVEGLSKWVMVRDCVKGAKAVRNKTITYLPNPDPEAPDADDRYKAYIIRALFLNVTARTRNAMVGMAFRKPAKVELPSETSYLLENATGDGLSLEHLGKKTVGDLLEVGRFGLLADYPLTKEGLTQAEVETLDPQASIKTYSTESILDWVTTVVAGKQVLSMVKLKEDKVTKLSIFETKTDTQYRVLYLDDAGNYAVEIWDESQLIEGPFFPRTEKGNSFKFIPFIIAGTYSNDPDVDDSALYDLAEINLGHYRNSADYEESCFMVGQPQPVVSGLTQSWLEAMKEVNDGSEATFKFGSRIAWTLPVEASAQILQVSPNTQAMEAMKHKEEQMVAIGAKLIDQNNQPETATAALLRHGSDASILSNIVQNSSAAITQSIEWCGLFMGTEGDVVHEINNDFYDKSKTAQDIIAEIQLYDRGLIAKSDIQDSSRQAGIVSHDRSNDDINEEVGETSPIE